MCLPGPPLLMQPGKVVEPLGDRSLRVGFGVLQSGPMSCLLCFLSGDDSDQLAFCTCHPAFPVCYRLSALMASPLRHDNPNKPFVLQVALGQGVSQQSISKHVPLPPDWAAFCHSMHSRATEITSFPTFVSLFLCDKYH